MPKSGTKYSPEEDDYLAQNFKTLEFEEMARALDRSEHSVTKRIDWLRREKRIIGYRLWWTAEEEADLRGYIKHYPVREISRIIGRTEKAILLKLHHLNLGDFQGAKRQQGYLITPEVAEVFGTTGPAIRQWVKCGWLKSERTGRNHTRYCFTPAAIYQFLREYSDKYSVFVMPESAYRQYAVRFVLPKQPRLLTTQQVAAMKNCAESTIIAALKTGRLTGIPPLHKNDPWRFRPEDVEHWTPQMNTRRAERLAAKKQRRAA